MGDGGHGRAGAGGAPNGANLSAIRSLFAAAGIVGRKVGVWR